MDGLGILERDGFATAPRFFESSELQSLVDAIGPNDQPGKRGLLNIVAVAKLARSDKLLNLVRPCLPSQPIPVRAIYFDKSPSVNWAVAWHQDLTVAVRSRVEVPGFGAWSTKNGVPHVQPPIELLEKMLTVRLHVDDCDGENGALRVIPGSHRFGRLSAERIRELPQQYPAFLCCMRAGDALLMRPLLLHASGRSKTHRQRRVLHIEYAGFTLRPPLEWRDSA